MKLITEVMTGRLPFQTGLGDSVMVLGSCFADAMGRRMQAAGFNVCVNPFGTLYNPESIAAAVERLRNGRPFTGAECVEMGAGAGKICSFSHHTSFARATAEEFLEAANASLEHASAFWKRCNCVVITLGTSMVWRREGATVSNCLKRPASEFSHEMLSLLEIDEALATIVEEGKSYIFTVSPIRHLSQGAHANTLSKARLHLALDTFLKGREACAYFPACEILLDELRDYRFYAEDLCHPSRTAEDIIWERFLDAALPASDFESIRANEKRHRQSLHRNIL